MSISISRINRGESARLWEGDGYESRMGPQQDVDIAQAKKTGAFQTKNVQSKGWLPAMVRMFFALYTCYFIWLALRYYQPLIKGNNLFSSLNE